MRLHWESQTGAAFFILRYRPVYSIMGGKLACNRISEYRKSDIYQFPSWDNVPIYTKYRLVPEWVTFLYGIARDSRVVVALGSEHRDITRNGLSYLFCNYNAEKWVI